jgi:putative ABC transport system substrate-binding protein
VELEAWHAGFGHHKRPAPACRTSPRGASTLAIIAALHAARCALIVAPETFTTANRELIIALAAHHRLPAIYGLRPFPLSGGLMSYGPDSIDTVQRAASYVDRILRGEKPADLPVQAPIKFEMIINLKTAKALGLTVPPDLLVAADEVIE